MRRRTKFSRHQAPHVDRRALVLGFALSFSADREPGDSIEVVAGIFSGSGDQEILFLVHEILAPVLAHLEIGGELNGICRAGLFAEAAEDAAREIDAE